MADYYKDIDDSYDVTLMEHNKINKESKTTAVYSTKNPGFVACAANEGRTHGDLLGSIKEARSEERKRVQGNSKAAYFNGKTWLKQTMKETPVNDKKAARKMNQRRRCRGQQRPQALAQNEPDVDDDDIAF